MRREVFAFRADRNSGVVDTRILPPYVAGFRIELALVSA